MGGGDSATQTTEFTEDTEKLGSNTQYFGASSLNPVVYDFPGCGSGDTLRAAGYSIRKMDDLCRHRDKTLQTIENAGHTDIFEIHFSMHSAVYRFSGVLFQRDPKG